MIDGIRAGADGMRLLSLKLDTAASNLANVSTAGYKKDEIAALPGTGGGAFTAAQYVDLAPGQLVNTGAQLDLAIDGRGFFAVGEGESAGYTRDGRFSLDLEGRLVTAAGLPVQGRDGAVRLDPALPAVIGPDGSVSQNGRTVDKIKVVDFEDLASLRKGPGGLLAASSDPVRSYAGLRQGFVEGSNVSTVEEMASLMKIMRSFETVQKAMTAQDAATGKLISSFGRFQ